MQEALLQGLGYAVSTGLFKDEAGVAAWIIEGPTAKLQIIGQWHTPG